MVQMPTSKDDNMEDDDAFPGKGAAFPGKPKTMAIPSASAPASPSRVCAFLIKNGESYDQEVVLFDNMKGALLPGGITIEGDYQSLKASLMAQAVKVGNIKLVVSDKEQLHNPLAIKNTSATGMTSEYQIRPYSYFSPMSFIAEAVDIDLAAGGSTFILDAFTSISMRIKASTSVEMSLFVDAVSSRAPGSIMPPGAGVPSYPKKAPVVPPTAFSRDYKLTGRKIRVRGVFSESLTVFALNGDILREIDWEAEGLEPGLWVVSTTGAARQIFDGFEFTELTPETILITWLANIRIMDRLDDFEYMQGWIEKCGRKETRDGYDLEWWAASIAKRLGAVNEAHKKLIRELLGEYEVICLEKSMDKKKK